MTSFARSPPTVTCDWVAKIGINAWSITLPNAAWKTLASTHRGDPSTIGKLLRDCKEAKETLSTRSRAFVECAFGSASMRVEIKQDEFRKMTLDLLDRTDFTVRQTLKAGNMKWTDIDKVLLVGGSTRMPAVREMLKNLSGNRSRHLAVPR